MGLRRARWFSQPCRACQANQASQGLGIGRVAWVIRALLRGRSALISHWFVGWAIHNVTLCWYLWFLKDLSYHYPASMFPIPSIVPCHVLSYLDLTYLILFSPVFRLEALGAVVSNCLTEKHSQIYIRPTGPRPEPIRLRRRPPSHSPRPPYRRPAPWHR